MNQFDTAYQNLLGEIMEHGIDEKNNRTGHVCRSLPGKFFQVDLAKGFPLLSLRKIPLKLFIAEQIWFLQGAKNLQWLQKFTPIWNDFADEKNEIESAYGYRWRKHFGRDQITGLVDLLSKDPSSRHGVIMMWDPADDGLANGTPKANVPCPYTFVVNIIGGKLHLHLTIRSNDIMLGCPHDTAGFALLAHFLAEKLNVGVGLFSTSIANAHIYDCHFEEAKELLDRELLSESVPFVCPKNAIQRAEKGDESLVQEIFEQLKANYTPQPSVGKMKIVL